MRQGEIDIPSQPKQLVAVCGCLEGVNRGDVVVLRNSLDPRYIVGECEHCGKKHIKEVA